MNKYPNSIKHNTVGCNYMTIDCQEAKHEKCTQFWCDCECHKETR